LAFPTIKTPFFYGWVIVACSLLAETAGSWSGLYALTVLLVPMSQDLHWTRGQLVGASTLAGVIGGFASPLFGRLIDKQGVRLTMAISAIVGGVTLTTLSAVSELWVYYLIFGVLLGITRPLTMMLGVATALANWFIQKRGRVTAIASTGVPIAAFLGIPVTQFIVVNYGWRTAWIVLGIGMILLIAIPSGLFMRRRPEDMGLLPDGEAAAGKGQGAAKRGQQPRSRWGVYHSAVDWETRDALRSRAFWVLACALPVISLPAPAMATSVVAFFQDKGLAPMAAAGAASSFAIGTLAARFIWGVVSEKLHIQYTYFLITLVSVTGSIFVILSYNIQTAYAAIIYFGLFAGGVLQLQFQIWPDYFGRRNIGAIRAWASPIQTLGIAFGPLFANVIFDVTGSYNQAFTIYAMTSLAGGLVMLLLGAPPQASEKHLLTGIAQR